MSSVGEFDPLKVRVTLGDHTITEFPSDVVFPLKPRIYETITVTNNDSGDSLQINVEVTRYGFEAAPHDIYKLLEFNKELKK